MRDVLVRRELEVRTGAYRLLPRSRVGVRAWQGLRRGADPGQTEAWLEELDAGIGWRLSHGERARLILLRALLTPVPKIIVDDDVLTALDPSTAHAVLDTLDAQPRSVRLSA